MNQKFEWKILLWKSFKVGLMAFIGAAATALATGVPVEYGFLAGGISFAAKAIQNFITNAL